MPYRIDQIQSIESIDDLKRVAALMGNHFFSPNTMRFFNSRISSRLYPVSVREGYFVTSERQDMPYSDPEPRQYTVRHYSITEGDNGYARFTIDTVDEFYALPDSASAHRAAKSLTGNFRFVS